MKCENCGHMNKQNMRVCHRMIAKTVNEMARRQNKKAKLEKRRVMDYLANFFLKTENQGKTVSTRTLINKYGLKGMSAGNLFKIYLDKFVCSGYLTKTEFNCRAGHIYQINETKQPCKYCEPGELFPTCNMDDSFFKDAGEFRLD